MKDSSISVRGFSLVELMIAIVAGMIVSLAVITFLLSSMKSNGEYVQSTRLTQELRNTLDMVVRDVGRAGYNDDALAYVSMASTSPFSPIYIKDSALEVTPGTAATYVNADADGCIMYSYDRTFPNGSSSVSGTPGSLDLENGEVRGIRRVVVGGVGVVEYAESTTGLNPTCDGLAADYSSSPADCNTASGWCALSDPKRVDITRFLIIDKGSDIASSMRVRNLGLLIEGRPTGTSDFTRAVSSDLKIHADCITAAVADCIAQPTPTP